MLNSTHWGLRGLALAMLLVACGGSASRRPGGAASDGGGEAGASDQAAAGTSLSGAPVAGVSSDGGRSGSEPGGSSGIGAGGKLPNDAGSSSGAGRASPLPLPPDCEARTHTEDEHSCVLNAFCSVQSQITNCQRLPSGRWECRCEHAPRRVFEIEGAPGLEACAVAAGVCDVGESELSRERCVTRIDDSHHDECLFGRACSREIELDFAPGARAWLVRDGSASCDRDESGESFACQCTYGAATREYDLFAESGDVACAPLVDFCMSEQEPEYGEEERCALFTATSSEAGCQRDEGCSAVMALDDAVALANLAPRNASCTAREGGGVDCYCSTRTSASLNLRLSGSPTDASCASTIEVCGKGVELVPTGTPSCEPQSLTVFENISCEADLSCQQPASVGEQIFTVEGRLLVRCARNEPDQPWACSCASDQQTARFRLGVPAASDAEACALAPAACLELIDVHLGPYGEIVAPPDPLTP